MFNSCYYVGYKLWFLWEKKNLCFSITRYWVNSANEQEAEMVSYHFILEGSFHNVNFDRSPSPQLRPTQWTSGTSENRSANARACTSSHTALARSAAISKRKDPRCGPCQEGAWSDGDLGARVCVRRLLHRPLCCRAGLGQLERARVRGGGGGRLLHHLLRPHQ